VDNSPGDRTSECKGLLVPKGWYKHKKKGVMISYECATCKEKKVNKFLEWDEIMADDLNVLLKLSAHENY
jgi:hypothetical protein